jgi:hypothetical protein
MPAVAALTAAELAAVRAHAALLDDSSSLDAPGSAYTKLLSSTTSPTETLDVWSRAYGPDGVKQYLCIGTAPVPVDEFFTVVQDENYRLKWDSSCAEVRTLRSFPSVTNPAASTPFDHSLHYWVAKYPMPLRKRDYVVCHVSLS